jgi:hypothetical protein
VNIEADADAWFEHHLPGHHNTSAAQPAAAVTIRSTTGGPVSNLFADVKAILHDGLEKLETIDEGAVGVVEAAKVNSTAVSIINTVAGIAHIPDPDGLLAGADAFLKTIAAAIAKGVTDTAPGTGAPVAGPSVAGQA